MSSAILDLPSEVQLREGESFSWQIEGVAHDGKLIVKKLSQIVPTLPDVVPDSKAAVERFLQLTASINPGKLTGATDEELDEMRWEYLKEKHLK